MNTYDRLAHILTGEYKLPTEKLLPEARLDDLGVDSLGVMELLFKIEDEFGIRVSTDQPELATVKDLVNYVDSLIASQASDAASHRAGT